MRLDVELKRVTDLAMAAELEYQRAKTMFAAVARGYVEKPGVDPDVAEIRAASDPLRRRAAADAAFYRAEFHAYATLGMLLLALAGGGDSSTHDMHRPPAADAVAQHEGWPAGRAAQRRPS